MRKGHIINKSSNRLARSYETDFSSNNNNNIKGQNKDAAKEKHGILDIKERERAALLEARRAQGQAQGQSQQQVVRRNPYGRKMQQPTTQQQSNNDVNMHDDDNDNDDDNDDDFDDNDNNMQSTRKQKNTDENNNTYEYILYIQSTIPDNIPEDSEIYEIWADGVSKSFEVVNAISPLQNYVFIQEFTDIPIQYRPEYLTGVPMMVKYRTSELFAGTDDIMAEIKYVLAEMQLDEEIQYSEVFSDVTDSLVDDPNWGEAVQDDDDDEGRSRVQSENSEVKTLQKMKFLSNTEKVREKDDKSYNEKRLAFVKNRLLQKSNNQKEIMKVHRKLAIPDIAHTQGGLLEEENIQKNMQVAPYKPIRHKYDVPLKEHPLFQSSITPERWSKMNTEERGEVHRVVNRLIGENRKIPEMLLSILQNDKQQRKHRVVTSKDLKAIPQQDKFRNKVTKPYVLDNSNILERDKKRFVGKKLAAQFASEEEDGEGQDQGQEQGQHQDYNINDDEDAMNEDRDDEYAFISKNYTAQKVKSNNNNNNNNKNNNRNKRYEEKIDKYQQVGKLPTENVLQLQQQSKAFFEMKKTFHNKKKEQQLKYQQQHNHDQQPHQIQQKSHRDEIINTNRNNNNNTVYEDDDNDVYYEKDNDDMMNFD